MKKSPRRGSTPAGGNPYTPSARRRRTPIGLDGLLAWAVSEFSQSRPIRHTTLHQPDHARKRLTHAPKAWWRSRSSSKTPIPPLMHGTVAPPGHMPRRRRDTIVGPPFTRGFERYLDGDIDRDSPPILRALKSMRDAGAQNSHSDEYLLCDLIRQWPAGARRTRRRTAKSLVRDLRGRLHGVREGPPQIYDDDAFEFDLFLLGALCELWTRTVRERERDEAR